MRKAKNRRGKWLGRGVAVLVIAALVSFFLKTRAERKWRGDERFTLIVWNGMMTVASFDPVTERGLKLILPPELEVVTVGGRGRWQVKVLPQIGEKYGGKWVADSVADYLSVGYTAYAKSDNLSGINLWDRFNWWQWSRKVRWEELELKTLPGVVEAKAADGQVYRELSSGFKAGMSGRLISTSISLEGAEVTVVNTTEVDGLGSHVAEVLENTGLAVKSVVSESSQAEEGEVLTGSEPRKVAISYKWMLKYFGCREGKDEGLGEKEIKIILGKKYRQWWLGEGS